MIFLSVAAAAGLFACLAYLGVILAAHICDAVVPFEDGPPAGRISIPILLGFAALLGGAISMRGIGTPELGMVAVLCLCLAAIWYSDVRSGIIPDVFTLGPLVAVLGVAVYLHHWSTILSSLVVFVPFAIAAVISKGRGMGWGDVKLVALGGAVLGMENAILAFGVACAAAVVIALVRGRRDIPIAFAPYLVVAIAFGAALGGIA